MTRNMMGLAKARDAWSDRQGRERGWVDIIRIYPHPLHLPIFFWVVVWNFFFIFPYILGMSSSQLTFIFFRGVAQPFCGCGYQKMAMDFDGFRGSGGEATVGGPSAAEKLLCPVMRNRAS